MNAIVVIAASAGGLEPLRRIIAALPAPCAASVFIVMHIGPNRSVLPALLSRPGIPAAFAREGAPIEPSHVYVAPPDQHMLLEPGRIRLSQGPKINHTRPAADPLFESAAKAYGIRVVGVVLSGGDGDGAAGLRVIGEKGGTVLVQHPEDAAAPSMPLAAIAADHPDACLPIAELAQRLVHFAASVENLCSLSLDDSADPARVIAHHRIRCRAASVARQSMPSPAPPPRDQSASVRACGG